MPVVRRGNRNHERLRDLSRRCLSDLLNARRPCHKPPARGRRQPPMRPRRTERASCIAGFGAGGSLTLDARPVSLAVVSLRTHQRMQGLWLVSRSTSRRNSSSSPCEPGPPISRHPIWLPGVGLECCPRRRLADGVILDFLHETNLFGLGRHRSQWRSRVGKLGRFVVFNIDCDDR